MKKARCDRTECPFEVGMLTSLPRSKSGTSLLPLKDPDMAGMKRAHSEPGSPCSRDRMCSFLPHLRDRLLWLCSFLCSSSEQVYPVTNSPKASIFGYVLTFYPLPLLGTADLYLMLQESRRIP